MQSYTSKQFSVQNTEIPPAPDNSIVSQVLLLSLFHSIN